MTDRELNDAVHRALATVKKHTPYRTGCLRHEATLLMARGGRSFVIYVDTDKAPYFKYVNGTRNGKSIRSTGYWQRAVDEVINNIARELGGRVTK